MYNGEEKFVKDVKKNDEIYCKNGKKAKIICVVKTNINNNPIEMVDINGLKITPW
jgi:hypothetical protein